MDFFFCCGIPVGWIPVALVIWWVVKSDKPNDSGPPGTWRLSGRRTCAHCGARVRRKARFCHTCGEPVRKTDGKA